MLYLLAAVSGQNIIGGLGSLHNANGMSAEQIVMQCGLADMAEFLDRGIDMSDYKLALDSIARVGPGGNFLTDALTMDLLRSDEFLVTRRIDSSGGYEAGAASMYELAHQEVERLIAAYQPTVPPTVREAIAAHFRGKYHDGKSQRGGCK
jgi:trimethylamine--corrinoid protein Co-methyltransferase